MPAQGNARSPSARAGAAPLQAAAELAFPTEFPLKIVGRSSRGFARRVLEIVRAHAPDFDPATAQTRASRGGAWLSVTIVVNAASRAQLDALYRDLCDHPDVVRVL